MVLNKYNLVIYIYIENNFFYLILIFWYKFMIDMFN